ncbi:MAG TPA: hypothetical protein VGD91_25765 [Trebonia sp.]
MELRRRWQRPGWRGPWSVAALGLAAALAAAGCTSGSGSTAGGTGSTAGPGTVLGGTPVMARPAVTPAQARRVFDAYRAASARAAKTGDQALALSVVTGVQRAVLAATLGRRTVVTTGTPSSAAYSSTLTITLNYVPQSYGTPTFYLPEGTGYPRFFAASARGTVPGLPAGVPATIVTGGTAVRADGTALLLFEQARVGAPWLLASSSQLPAGMTLPKLAVDRAGYVPVVSSSAALLVRPDEVGALQAAVVDDGPASTAARAVSAGPLTTGLYTGARHPVDGLRAPAGDVYQWELAGSALLPGFALRTADGGALTFYAMSLDMTVAVPDEISKTDPVRSGPPIPIPDSLLPLLPPGQAAPLIQLSAGQTLSFAAVDPPAGGPAGKVQVIAMGGGLTSASAT